MMSFTDLPSVLDLGYPGQVDFWPPWAMSAKGSVSASQEMRSLPKSSPLVCCPKSEVQLFFHCPTFPCLFLWSNQLLPHAVLHYPVTHACARAHTCIHTLTLLFSVHTDPPHSEHNIPSRQVNSFFKFLCSAPRNFLWSAPEQPMTPPLPLHTASQHP